MALLHLDCKICLALAVNTLIMTSWWNVCLGFPQYLNYIPNGGLVPNPCTNETTDVWFRVGHAVLQQSEDRNKLKNDFGKNFTQIREDVSNDFYKIWPKLCKIDSDQDGRINGIELGDPDCQWTIGNQIDPTKPLQITHPGIPDTFDGTTVRPLYPEDCR